VVNTITDAIKKTFNKYDTFDRYGNRRNSVVSSNSNPTYDYYNEVDNGLGYNEVDNGLGYSPTLDYYDNSYDDYNYLPTTTLRPLMMPRLPYSANKPNLRLDPPRSESSTEAVRPSPKDFQRLISLRQVYTPPNSTNMFSRRRSETDNYVSNLMKYLPRIKMPKAPPKPRKNYRYHH
jgi:hypothetical protein